jgi:hypothetical protein
MPHTYETAALGLAESAVGEAGIAQTKDQHGGSVDMEIKLEGTTGLGYAQATVGR